MKNGKIWIDIIVTIMILYSHERVLLKYGGFNQIRSSHFADRPKWLLFI